MDYSNLTLTQLTATANAFAQIDALMQDDLPPNFAELLTEYLGMKDEDRMHLQSEMSAKANFLAYAESMGNAEMADALQKVASDMAKMDSKALRSIADNGLSKVAEK